ncbi:Hypothetical predicted protein [Scomber scombrus]|uniref:Uncharacterized protein n=1 Tax=Scomber scombrus TaxID=13677 RepID=A0AAV1QIG9_SCOSC
MIQQLVHGGSSQTAAELPLDPRRTENGFLSDIYRLAGYHTVSQDFPQLDLNRTADFIQTSQRRHFRILTSDAAFTRQFWLLVFGSPRWLPTSEHSSSGERSV